MATERGSSPVGISASFTLASPATLMIDTDPLSGLATTTSASSSLMAIGLE
jgi:hypothetical protein